MSAVSTSCSVAHVEAPPRVLVLVGIGRASELRGFAEAGLDATTTAATCINEDELAAIVVEAPRSMFVGEEAEAKLADVTWLAPRADAHERILRAAAVRGSILPTRFGAVFVHESSIRALLRRHAVAIHAALQHIVGCDEFIIRVVGEEGAAAERLVQTWLVEQGAASKPGGQRYLMERRLRERAMAEAAAALGREARDRATPLMSMARAVTPARGLGRRADGRTVALSAAVLVERRCVPDFLNTVRASAAAAPSGGLSLEVSGPWPAYHFCPSFAET